MIQTKKTRNGLKEKDVIMIGKRKKSFSVKYDPEKEYPVIKASICNGEKVAGFKSREDGRFREVTFIANEADLKAFKEACGTEEIKTEY